MHPSLHVDPVGIDRHTGWPEQLQREAAFVHGLARALLRDRELAQDVAQDALVAALEQRANAPQMLRGWLAAVTRRLAGRARTAERRHAAREQRAARREGGDDEQRTQQQLALHRRLCDAVLALPEPYRTAVALRYLDGLAPRAIARRLRRDSATVRQQVHRGLLLLRQRLDREFGDRNSWVSAFAVCGLGSGWPSATLASVLLMKKIALAAVLLASAGTWWLLHDGAADATAALAGGAAAATAPIAVRAETAAPAAPATADADAGIAQRKRLAFTVRVVDEDSGPVRGATVRCWRERGSPVVAATSADGAVTFAADDGAGALLVDARSHLQRVELVPRLLGDLEVRLARGARLDGHVDVDGAPAPAGLVLSLASAQPAVPDGLPAAAKEWLEAHSWLTQGQTRTDADGGFAFVGLPADWRGGLWVPPTLRVLGDQPTDALPETVSVARPQSGLRIATTQLASVRGRVVWDDDGTPVPWPEFFAYGTFADGDNSVGYTRVGDETGCFAHGFCPANATPAWLDPAHRSPLASVTLQVQAEGSAGRTDLRRDAAALRDGGEWIVRLPRAAITHFLAVDEQDRPVAGARVQVHGVGAATPPTGSDGRGAFAGARTDLLVGAPGFQVAVATPRREAAGTAADPLVFVLVAQSELALRLRTPAGDAVTGVRFELRAPRPLFHGNRPFQDNLDRAFGNPECCGDANSRVLPDGTRELAEVRCSFAADAHGEAVMHSLAPGLRCTVAVKDVLFHDVLTRAFTTPACGERLDLELVIAGAARRIAGRVLASDGTPLGEARVGLRCGRGFTDTGTGRDGAFAFAGLYGDDEVRLVASSPGHATETRAGIGRAQDGVPIEFRLPPARRVTVRVRDERDQPVSLVVLADAGQRDRQGQQLAPGEFLFPDLPPGTVRFHCTLGDQPFAIEHDTERADAVLRVPMPAAVTLTTAVAWPEERGSWFAVTATRLPTAAATAPAPPFEFALPAADAAQLLLPGRYRFALLQMRGDGAALERAPLGPQAEVELRAGATTAVVLR